MARKVYKGPQDASVEAKKKALESFSGKVGNSVRQTLQIFNDENGNPITGQMVGDLTSSLDQYPSIVKLEDGSRKIVGPKSDPSVQRQAVGGQIPHSDKVPQTRIVVSDNRPANHEEKRAQDIAKVMNAYNKASEQRAFRSRNTGTRAASIALSNPAAGTALARGRQAFEDQPVDAITGGFKAGSQAAGVQKQVSDLAANDQERDPSSQVSKLAKQQLLKQFGITASQNSTAADIKRVFPMIKVDTQRDTQYRGQNMTAQTATDNRLSREQQGALNRANQKAIAEGHDRAGIGRTVISGTLAQDTNARRGSTGDQMKTADAATIPNSLGQGFYITKPGIPPNPHRAQEITDLGGQSRKYISALDQAIRLVNEAGGRPAIWDKNWPAVKSALARAVQANIKAIGNGVANGPDIVQAQREIGDVGSFQTWLRKGLLQSMMQARNSVPRAYEQYADSQGYMKSDKPSQVTMTRGTGGSASTSKPVNPALASGANAIAGDYGLPPIVGTNTNPSGTPEIPAAAPQPPQGTPVRVTLKNGQVVDAIRMPDGKIVRK